MLREDKAAYQQNMAKAFSANHKLLYKHVNGLRKVRQGVPPLTTADNPTRTATKAANALRMQYAQHLPEGITIRRFSSFCRISGGTHSHLLYPRRCLAEADHSTQAQIFGYRYHSSRGSGSSSKSTGRAIGSVLPVLLRLEPSSCHVE
ncbi:unnamed protein product, partial [Dicrocoelium dendriticum]